MQSAVAYPTSTAYNKYRDSWEGTKNKCGLGFCAPLWVGVDGRLQGLCKESGGGVKLDQLWILCFELKNLLNLSLDCECSGVAANRHVN